MEKFQKRLSKNMKSHPIDCLVLGNGFDYFMNLLDMFNTVFVYENTLNLKRKNLIYRKSIKDVYHLKDITAIFIDLDKLKLIDELSPLLSSVWPDLFIEGDDVIPRTESKVLYQLGYNAVAQLGFCHVWRKVK